MPAGGFGARVRLASGLLSGCGWPRWCRGAATCWLDTESCCPWRAVGLGASWAHCRGVVILGCAAGAWVPVGLLLGLVVIHPVLGWACCWCRIGCLGPLEEDHVL